MTVVPGRPARGETVTGSFLGRETGGGVGVVVLVVVEPGVAPRSWGVPGSCGVPGS